jgi:hypothetical protein
MLTSQKDTGVPFNWMYTSTLTCDPYTLQAWLSLTSSSPPSFLQNPTALLTPCLPQAGFF